MYLCCSYLFVDMPALALVRTQGAESVPALTCGKG
jgi:hypothetical protein